MAVLQEPVPESITQLQGYQLCLRFQATEADIQSLLQSGYKSADCDPIATSRSKTITSNYRLPDPSYDRFDPPWQPQAISSNQCWTANPVSNSWTGSGTHHLLIDRENKLIYFSGIGS